MTAGNPRGFGVCGAELRVLHDEPLAIRLVGIEALLETGIAVLDAMSEDAPNHPLLFAAAYPIRMAYVLVSELPCAHPKTGEGAEQAPAAQPNER